jgi:hypothetical protein
VFFHVILGTIPFSRLLFSLDHIRKGNHCNEEYHSLDPQPFTMSRFRAFRPSLLIDKAVECMQRSLSLLVAMKIFSCSLSFPYSESKTRLNAFRTLPTADHAQREYVGNISRYHKTRDSRQ